MRLPDGHRLLHLVFNRDSFRNYRQQIKLLNQYLLPLILLALLFTFFLFQNREKIDASAFFAFSTFAALSLCGVLLFRLAQERNARRSAESKAYIDGTRLFNIYNSSIIGLLYTRFDGVITEANDVFLQIIGYSRQDLEQRLISWVDMTPPEYTEISQLALAQLRDKGTCDPFTKEYRKKDGERVHVLLASSLLNKGDHAEILTYAIDITNLKASEKREQALSLKMRHQQDEMFRVLNDAPVAIVIRKGPDLAIEYANQTALNYTPFNQAQAIGSSADEFHQKLKTGVDMTPLKNVYHTGKAVKGKRLAVKYDQDGSGNLTEGWFDYVWEPTFDEDGNVTGVATFTFEVTDLVRANSKLKANEQHFRFIADAIPNKMWTSGPDGVPTYYNQGWIEYLQETDIESLRAKAWEAVHPEELEYVRSQWKHAIEHGTDMEMETRLRRHDGIYQWHLTRMCACKDESGQVTMYVGSSTNIHEQKTAAIALRLSNEKKDEFLGVATHELRTPITSMKVALQSLERAALSGTGPDKAISLVNLANRQVNKLTTIVNDLVDVSKIQSGKLELNKSIFTLSGSVKEIIADFELQKPDCKFVLQVNEETLVTADKVRIEQVIANLLSNAIKYSPPKGVISIIIESRQNHTVCSVSDEGIGIPGDLQPFIFDRFFRVHPSSQLFSGLGLGLFIAAEIVKQHGGSIEVQSQEGKGSCFSFSLPNSEN